MKLLKSVKQKNIFSEISYYVLNLSLVAMLFAMSQTLNSPILAIVLVVLSKWRILAVRPKFWWTNLQSSVVDLIVGVSLVALMYVPYGGLTTQQVTMVQAGLALVYAIWLVFIKPLSKRWQMLLQSAFAVFFGTIAMFSVSYDWWASVVVLVALLMGYSASRHYLLTYDEDQITLLSTIWAIVFAEISLLAYYWTYSYAFFGVPGMRIPQATIILLALSLVAVSVYKSWQENDKKVMLYDVAPPAILSSLLIIVILLFFNSAAI